jgi:hypothetical protein
VLAGEDSTTTRISIEDFAVSLLAPGVALATWRSVTATVAGSVAARRASLWRSEPDGTWRMVYHQGTPVSEPGALGAASRGAG